MTRAKIRRAARDVATFAQAKALADPLRYRVFENLVAEARTAKQMAAHLGTHPTRLYHHFRVLERAGLIRPAGTKQKRGTTEKYFKAAVDRIEVGSPAARGVSPLAAALLEGVLHSTLADLKLAGQRRAGGRAASETGAYVRRYRIRPTPERAAEIRACLDALAELCEGGSADENTQEFGLTLAFYPTAEVKTRRKNR